MITVESLNLAISQRITTFNNSDYPLQSRPVIHRSLADCLNQILAKNLTSPFDIPRQNVSSMDGFAITKGSQLATGSQITVVGESQAGAPFKGNLQINQGIRIFTGAVIPEGCDTIVMQENTNHDTIKATANRGQSYTITLTKPADIGAHIRHQGEEISCGEQILVAGKRLNPADISLLASLGIDKVSVYQPLVVGILATGDELVPLGESLTSLAQIYNSNTPTLKSLLTQARLPIDIIDYGIIADDLKQTQSTVARAMTECDVLISTAGVSVGDYDFLTTVVETLGQINHYKVAMKPGKPFVFGELTQNTLVPVLYFGLPGNPLSTVVGALQLVIPALWQLTGALPSQYPTTTTVSATLSNDARKSPGRADYQRGLLSKQTDGHYQVSVFSNQQSHRIKHLSQANCFVVLPKDSGDIVAGSQVQVQPFPWW